MGREIEERGKGSRKTNCTYSGCSAIGSVVAADGDRIALGGAEDTSGAP